MTKQIDWKDEHIYFVTGRLAENAVRDVVERLAVEIGFQSTIGVMPITVAALITAKWLQRHWDIPATATCVVVPGYLADHLHELQEACSKPVYCGPRDIRDLPNFFGKEHGTDPSYGQYRIEIIAEINHAPKYSMDELLAEAKRLQSQGADVIDIGCIPGSRWPSIGDAIAAVTETGIRVSIDSFDPWEVSLGCERGAELVLSVNSSNRDAAVDWGTEVVVIPDSPDDWSSLLETTDFLQQRGVSMRLDPILEPIGCGFTASLQRYARCRREFSNMPMMMGIGNLTELTDVDSAGVNVLLLGICAELQIDSVLTTQVINWARSSVQECDVARRLVDYAQRRRIPPKNLERRLVMLRDARVNEFSEDLFNELAESIRDHNLRIFTANGEIHLVSAGLHVHSPDPFLAMQQLLDSHHGRKINVSHAFYLGFEMSKAMTAIQLGKQYDQDRSLDWGLLTQPERLHRISEPNWPRDS